MEGLPKRKLGKDLEEHYVRNLNHHPVTRVVVAITNLNKGEIMSVMMLSFELYQEVFNKACGYRFKDTVDTNYCSTLSMTEERVLEWISDLYELNDISCCIHHKDEFDKQACDHERARIMTWKWHSIHRPVCNPYQMLKHLKCIQYQIEIRYVREAGMSNRRLEASYKILCDAIEEITDMIISHLPEYANAKWAFV